MVHKKSIFYFHAYMIESMPFEKEETPFFYVEILKYFFSLSLCDRPSIAQPCSKSGVHILSI